MVALSAAACADDGVPTFNPPEAPRRALVAIEEIDASGSTLIWDVGTSKERVVPLSLDGRMFSVPADATPGPHTVMFDGPSGHVGPFTFTVKDETLNLVPRIDRITTVSASFDPGGVQVGLYVQGANVEVGSVVEIEGVKVATVAHKGITNQLYGVPHSSLDYPIHHYLALVAIAGLRPPGSTLSVVVHNDDGSSEPHKYTVPASAQALDSDGDLLPDTWEQAGHDATGDGKNDADPHRPDVFVELDVMTFARPPTPPDAAGMGAVEAVQAMFAAAPLLSLFAPNGINLVVASGTVPFFEEVIFDVPEMAGNAADGEHTVLFSDLKRDHFDHRDVTVAGETTPGVYHYVVWAHSLFGGAGESDAVLGGEFEPGDDIVIGSVGFTGARSDAELLAHELGHNLGQRHGGATDEKMNPNYWSVMSAQLAVPHLEECQPASATRHVPALLLRQGRGRRTWPQTSSEDWTGARLLRRHGTSNQ